MKSFSAPLGLVALVAVLGACDAARNGDGPDAQPSACGAGLADCDHDGSCETDVTAAANCGGCGLACPTGPESTATCSHGTCGIVCSAGFGDCDGDASNGCESDLTQPGTCGACGNSCGGACVNGACESCDDGLALDSAEPLDAAKALGLCSGVVSAKWVMPNGDPPPVDNMTMYSLGHGLLPDFGPHVPTREGHHLLALSSGSARRPIDPGFEATNGFMKMIDGLPPAGFPRPSPACPGVETGPVKDAVALELELTAPDWAKGFAFDFDFYTDEWPVYLCTPYNDFFVALLLPTPVGQVDGDISFDPMGNPISVNAAFVRVCMCQGGPPCQANGQTFECPKGSDELIGTGFDQEGGHAATSWLTSTAPVEPGATIRLRLTIYDSADYIHDSTVLLDKFRWLPRSPVVTTEPIP
jgi:hypothetical protein